HPSHPSRLRKHEKLALQRQSGCLTRQPGANLPRTPMSSNRRCTVSTSPRSRDDSSIFGADFLPKRMQGVFCPPHRSLGRRGGESKWLVKITTKSREVTFCDHDFRALFPERA